MPFKDVPSEVDFSAQERDVIKVLGRISGF